MLILFLMVLGLSGCAQGGVGIGDGKTYFFSRGDTLTVYPDGGSFDSLVSITITPYNTFILTVFYDLDGDKVADEKYLQSGIVKNGELISTSWSCPNKNKVLLLAISNPVFDSEKLNFTQTYFSESTYTFNSVATQNIPSNSWITLPKNKDVPQGCNFKAYYFN